MTYSSNGPTVLSSLPWEMFLSRNLEGELIPPTRSTLFPHAENELCMHAGPIPVSSSPILPKLEENGWNINIKDNGYEPVRCVAPLALKAVLELVKCGCQKKRSKNCSCVKNKLPCTAICKCYAWDCNSCSGIHKSREENGEMEEEEND